MNMSPDTTLKLKGGGLFAGYIDTFLKLKAEASGYHAWVQITAEEERCIESFWKSEGMRIDKSQSRLTLLNVVWRNCASNQCGGNDREE